MLAHPKQAERGSINFCTTKDGEMMAVNWYDNKEVLMLTTKFQPDGHTVQRKTYDKLKTNFRKSDVPCCTVIHHYNAIMGDTDLGDKSRNLRSLEKTIGTKKWYIRLWFGLVGIAIHNAYVIFKELHPTTRKTDFLLDLQQQLINLHVPNVPLPRFKNASGTGTNIESPNSNQQFSTPTLVF